MIIVNFFPIYIFITVQKLLKLTENYQFSQYEIQDVFSQYLNDRVAIQFVLFPTSKEVNTFPTV